uniref:Uncharacterized protein n=1 Tax=Prolemur simus TaxID=1328070 RepID=A0A8C8ZS80_PROSS
KGRAAPPPGRTAELGACAGAAWHRLEECLMFSRLWHQLTLQVLNFEQDLYFAQGDGLIKVNNLPCYVRLYDCA